MATINVQTFAGDVNVGGTVSGNGSGLTALNGSQVTTGTVAAARIDNLDGSKITTGTVAAARIDNLDASKITSGTISRPVTTTGAVNAASLYTDDYIYHDGDTDTNIRFPAADTITMETAGTERMRITSDGTIGIGLTNPTSTYKLHVSGQIYATDDISAFSDERMKENVIPIDKALEKVCSIGGYTYNKIDESRRSAGVLAQEVAKVLPEVVYGSEDTNYSVAYGNMVSLLIEAIKELNHKLVKLENKI